MNLSESAGSLLNTLISFDHWLFEKINTGMSNPFFDRIFPIVTELLRVDFVKWFVVPALLLGILFSLRSRFVFFVLAMALAIGITDMTSHHLIKKSIERPRPPQTEGLMVELRTFPHAGYSFPSNHAANNFAGAVILSYFFFRGRRYFFAFASLIAFSRVYVGIHFPFDVLAGAALGASVGVLVLKAIRPFEKWLSAKIGTKASSRFPSPPSH